MAYRSQRPDMAELSRDLEDCHNLFLKCKRRRDPKPSKVTPLDASFGNIALDATHASALAQYENIEGMGYALRPRLCAAITTQKMLVPKKHPARLNPGVKNGRFHSLITALLDKSGPQFFTITAEQARTIDTYTGLDGYSGQCFFIHETLNSLPPIGVERAPAFQGEILFGIKWDELYIPKQVRPGNIIPASLVEPYGIGVRGDTLISLLGEACAVEAGGMLLCIHTGIEQLVENEAYRASPKNPADMSHQELVKLVTQQNKRHDVAEFALSSLTRGLESKFEYLGRFHAIFRGVSRDQAVNPRPGLWSPATPGQPSEFGGINPLVQGAVCPESMYPQHTAASGGVSTHLSNPGQPRAASYPPAARPRPVIGPLSNPGRHREASGPPAARSFPTVSLPPTAGTHHRSSQGPGSAVPQPPRQDGTSSSAAQPGNRHSTRPKRNLYGAAGRPDFHVPDEDGGMSM